jgi:hypothetical protein
MLTAAQMRDMTKLAVVIRFATSPKVEKLQQAAVSFITLPPSCADCLEIWEPQPPGKLTACPGLYRDCFTFFYARYVTRTDVKYCLCQPLDMGKPLRVETSSEHPLAFITSRPN